MSTCHTSSAAYPRDFGNPRRRASNNLTYPRFGPLFFRTSSYAHSCASLLQVPHVGLAPSHRNFLLRHNTQAIRLGLFAPSPSFEPSSLFVRGLCGRPLLFWSWYGCCERSLKKLSLGDSEESGAIFGRNRVPSWTRRWCRNVYTSANSYSVRL